MTTNVRVNIKGMYLNLKYWILVSVERWKQRCSQTYNKNAEQTNRYKVNKFSLNHQTAEVAGQVTTQNLEESRYLQ